MLNVNVFEHTQYTHDLSGMETFKKVTNSLNWMETGILNYATHIWNVFAHIQGEILEAWKVKNTLAQEKKKT